MARILELNPESYVRHTIHKGDKIWAETNCYVDVVCELIHALGFEPEAAFTFALSLDFEGDQWTFFKFSHYDLYDMFGLDVQELNPWLRLLDHVDAQIDLGRPILMEADSYYLPDTFGTTYQQEHVKSTIAIVNIDKSNRQLGYFHGQGFYELGGADFDHLFHTEGLPHENVLPPYIEFVKRSDLRISQEELLEKSITALIREFGRVAQSEPFNRFAASLEAKMAWLCANPIDVFHKYAFANFRQVGACFEIAATYMTWLSAQGETGLDKVQEQFLEISELSKVCQFKLARAVARGKDIDLKTLYSMHELWCSSLQTLRLKYCS